MLRGALSVAALAACLPAQSVIPAKAGLISYSDEAYVDGRLVETASTRFFVINENSVLRNASGHTEVLLGPCSAMWVDEQSSMRIASSVLSDVRVELLSGSVVIATGDMIKGSKLTVLVKTASATAEPRGAYRFDADPPRVKALAGKITVEGNRAISLTAGRLLLLDGVAQSARFDKQNADSFEIWSNGRAAYLARLAGQQKRDAIEPAPQSDQEPHTHGPGTAPRHTQTFPDALPNLPISGCGVTGW
jgi:hypothetical protein